MILVSRRDYFKSHFPYQTVCCLKQLKLFRIYADLTESWIAACTRDASYSLMTYRQEPYQSLVVKNPVVENFLLMIVMIHLSPFLLVLLLFVFDSIMTNENEFAVDFVDRELK